MSETTSLSSTYLEPEPTDVPQARAMLERAEWASRAFRMLDKAAVDRILEAVVAAAVDHAQEYAERAVAETGFGVVEHKRLKNEACSRGVLDFYAGADFVTPRIDDELQDRRGAPPRRGRAGAHAVDEPGGHRLLQDPAQPDDPQRRRGESAPDGQARLC